MVANSTSSISGIQTSTKRAFHDANFPVDDEGRTYHLGTKVGPPGVPPPSFPPPPWPPTITSHAARPARQQVPPRPPPPAQRGEVANRILSVGSNERAVLISQYLDPPSPGRPVFKMVSSRGFLTVTGAPAPPPHLAGAQPPGPLARPCHDLSLSPLGIATAPRRLHGACPACATGGLQQQQGPACGWLGAAGAALLT
jgi:hypothetical protein